MNQERYAKLKKDRPFLRHKREQREAQAVREWQALQELHARRESREALDFKLKAIPAVVGAVVTAIVMAEQEDQAKQRQWAMFHTLWAMNRARGAK